MKLLLVGNGGREHALAWRLARSKLAGKLYAAPGNPGIAACAECVAIDVMDFERIARFCQETKIDLVVIGPEEPLAAGLADRLEEARIRVFGPNRRAAQLEADKWFAKELMRHQAVPTAEARLFTSAEAARDYIQSRETGVVVKAAGLAKGKGVSVCFRHQDALEAVDRLMKQRVFGEAGARVVIEELLNGPECSVLAFIERRSIYLMETAQDHKALEDGDTGPMTGGMGAYSPAPIVGDAMLRQIERDIFVPVMDGLRREEIDYRGVLYAGLMLTPNGPKVLEFNCRFGDPETQPLMMRLQSDLLRVMLAVCDGKLDEAELRWDPRPAVSVVAAAGGYPLQSETGKVIEGIADAEALDDVRVFHSGTAKLDGRLVTAGGRVLSVTALGATIAEAQQRAYDALGRIHFDGMRFRRDIAWRALQTR